jgi:putative ABC transport system permease protein
VISQTMARMYFPNQDPLGKRLKFGFPFENVGEREIVGIAGDVRDLALGEDPKPMMYVPFDQAPFWGGNVVVKSTLSVASVAATVREEVRRIDKDLPVTDVAAMPELVEASVAQTRFRTLLLTLFAGMALLLAATGIFGVISYSVSCRTSSGSILGTVFRETLMLASMGLVIGLPCALAASHLIGHLLFGVSANDPSTLGAVALALVATAAVAGYVPARRAMRVDPMVALRHE